MTRTEHLLTILAEECNEVAQRASKALRFGLAEVEPEQADTNAMRIAVEFADLLGVYQMLAAAGHLMPLAALADNAESKARKVEKFLRYSAECGTLSDPVPPETTT